MNLRGKGPSSMSSKSMPNCYKGRADISQGGVLFVLLSKRPFSLSLLGKKTRAVHPWAVPWPHGHDTDIRLGSP